MIENLEQMKKEVESKGFDCRKTALTRARILTTYNQKIYHGVIETLEGSVKFAPGDFLAIGPNGERYPIKQENFCQTKELIPGSRDRRGFSLFKTTTTVKALQMENEFEVEVSTGDKLKGKSGDYMILNGNKTWVVDKEIFEKTYCEVEVTPKP